MLADGQNALAATVSILLGTPVIAATGLRPRNVRSARGAASFATSKRHRDMSAHLF